MNYDDIVSYNGSATEMHSHDIALYIFSILFYSINGNNSACSHTEQKLTCKACKACKACKTSETRSADSARGNGTCQTETHSVMIYKLIKKITFSQW